MSLLTDPPSVARKFVGLWNRVRGFFRKLVTRRTLLIAIKAIYWMAKILALLKNFV